MFFKTAHFSSHYKHFENCVETFFYLLAWYTTHLDKYHNEYSQIYEKMIKIRTQKNFLKTNFKAQCNCNEKLKVCL
jgi:hypothetical protein